MGMLTKTQTPNRPEKLEPNQSFKKFRTGLEFNQSGYPYPIGYIRYSNQLPKYIYNHQP